MRRKGGTTALVVAGSLVAGGAYRRLAARRSERIDLHFEDGSMVSLPGRSHDGAPLLELARDVLAAARR